MIENPSSSMIWGVPQLKSLISDYGGHFAFADMCAYGAKWKKSSTFVSFNMQKDTLLRCPGCAQHLHLSGKDKCGHFRTARGQQYPTALCEALASSFHRCYTLRRA